MTATTGLTIAREIHPEAIDALVRGAVGLVAMFAFIPITPVLPVTGRELSATDITVGELLVGAESLGAVATLVRIGSNCRDVVVTPLDGDRPS